jgi:hypothetical protein
MAVNVYSLGAVYCSVCAPVGMAGDDVVAAVTASHPTGLDHGWRVADEPFASGEANPHHVEGCPGMDGTTRHWLLVC